MSVGSAVRLQLRLPGPWEPFDPEDPLPVGTDPAVVEALQRSALLTPPAPVAGAEFVLAARMIDFPQPGHEVAPPLMAALAVTRMRPTGVVEVARTPDGDLIVERTTHRTNVDWPEVGRVEFHHVRYVLPTPDGTVMYGLDFSTPNLPLTKTLEAMFDVIIEGINFVE